MTPRAPVAEGGGADCLTRGQAYELVNIAMAAHRMAHRTGTAMSLCIDKIAAFYGVTKPTAEVVIAELQRIVERLDEVKEEAVIALATPPSGPAARAGTTEGKS